MIKRAIRSIVLKFLTKHIIAISMTSIFSLGIMNGLSHFEKLDIDDEEKKKVYLSEFGVGEFIEKNIPSGSPINGRYAFNGEYPNLKNVASVDCKKLTGWDPVKNTFNFHLCRETFSATDVKLIPWNKRTTKKYDLNKRTPVASLISGKIEEIGYKHGGCSLNDSPKWPWTSNTESKGRAGWGRTIRVISDNKEWTVQSSHLIEFGKGPDGTDLKVGDRVSYGQIIGFMERSGSTGCSTAPHVHLEIKKRGCGKKVLINNFNGESGKTRSVTIFKGDKNSIAGNILKVSDKIGVTNCNYGYHFVDPKILEKIFKPECNGGECYVKRAGTGIFDSKRINNSKLTPISADNAKKIVKFNKEYENFSKVYFAINKSCNKLTGSNVVRCSDNIPFLLSFPRKESKYMNNKLSYVGAAGYFQFMPHSSSLKVPYYTGGDCNVPYGNAVYSGDIKDIKEKNCNLTNDERFDLNKASLEFTKKIIGTLYGNNCNGSKVCVAAMYNAGWWPLNYLKEMKYAINDPNKCIEEIKSKRTDGGLLVKQSINGKLFTKNIGDSSIKQVCDYVNGIMKYEQDLKGI